MEQHVLHHLITEDDINSMVLVNASCGRLQFTVGKIISISEHTSEFVANIYRNIEQYLEGHWQPVKDMYRTYPMSLYFMKGENVMIQNGTLSKRAQTLIEKQYYE